MQLFEYKVVSAPRRAKRAKGARTTADRFARTLTDMINKEADGGWEYMRADTMPMDEKKGMLSSASEVFQTVLIFRRAQGAGAASVTELRPVLRDSKAPEAPLSLGPATRRED